MKQDAKYYHNEGYEESKKQDFEKGIKQDKKSIVINMSKDNMPLSTISKYVNLSVYEVEKIVNNLEKSPT